MISRMRTSDIDHARQIAERLDEAGLEVALITEKVDEGEVYLIATPTSADDIREFVDGLEIIETDE